MARIFFLNQNILDYLRQQEMELRQHKAPQANNSQNLLKTGDGVMEADQSVE